MIRALCVGECMIELRAIDDSTMRVGYAGDTYNTAVYLRRSAAELGVDVEVGYLTGLGSDEFSADMRAAWKRDGVADRSIPLADYLPGLYTVRVDDRGERRFSYWRSASAAQTCLHRHRVGRAHGRRRCDSPVGSHLAARFSCGRGAARGTVGDPAVRGRAHQLRHQLPGVGLGGPAEAARVMDEVSKVATVVLATFEDEVAMHHCQSVQESATRLAELGVPEVVVKSGAEGAHLLVGSEAVHIPAPASSASSTPPPPATPSPADIWQRGWGVSRPPRRPGSRPRSRPPSSPTPERSSPRRSRSSRRGRFARDADGSYTHTRRPSRLWRRRRRHPLPSRLPRHASQIKTTHLHQHPHNRSTINVNGDGVMP